MLITMVEHLGIYFCSVAVLFSWVTVWSWCLRDSIQRGSSDVSCPHICKTAVAWTKYLSLRFLKGGKWRYWPELSICLNTLCNRKPLPLSFHVIVASWYDITLCYWYVTSEWSQNTPKWRSWSVTKKQTHLTHLGGNETLTVVFIVQ